MRVAAIGMGSNSLRMLVAELNGGQLHRLKRYREGLRLFAALDEQNRISAPMISLACKKIAEFCEKAKGDGAERVFIFATSAVRDCANQEEFSAAIQRASGIPLDICEGEREASLSYHGARMGKNCALIDIGGGSTEVIFGSEREICFSHSFQIGAVRLYRTVPLVTMEDAIRLKDQLVEQMGQIGREPLPQSNWVGVGGTFTTSVALVSRKGWNEREHVHGFRLHRAEVEQAVSMLVSMPMEERLKLPYLQPQRADIIVHGLVILLACFDAWRIPEIIVSEYGNLEGYLKDQYQL